MFPRQGYRTTYSKEEASLVKYILCKFNTHPKSSSPYIYIYINWYGEKHHHDLAKYFTASPSPVLWAFVQPLTSLLS
ncbi:hypothetical protein PZA11_000314 [Diplocarpon coronariae]